MKNKFYPLVALTFLLSSCGTANYYSSTSYEDPAYYRPGTEVKIVRNVTDEATDQELQALKEKTREVIVVDENSGKTILPLSKADTVFVDINEYDSFEELLTKFNSPEYQIQVVVAEDDENWNYQWYWNNPYYYWNHAWGRGFGYPYFYGNYGYYGYPGYYSYWDPWYYPGYYGFYDYYSYYGYYGYYGYYPYYYGMYDNLYYWNYYRWEGPGWHHDHNYGNVTDSYFYGRRGSDERNTGNGTPSSGSYTRRSNTNISQIRGYNTSDKNAYQGTRTSESVYRRDNQNRVSNGAVYNQNVVSTRQNPQRNGGGSSYSRTATTNNSERNSAYRAPARQTDVTQRSSNINRTSNSSSNSSTRSEYQRNNSNYSQPTTRETGSYNNAGSSGSSSSSGSRSSSGSGGSVYRR